ncbi:MAG: hypothetical protein R3E34_02770 [Rhodocyclaceae bacterium]
MTDLLPERGGAWRARRRGDPYCRGAQRGALKALDGVDLEVRQGEFFGLLGPNGASAETTLQRISYALAGVARVDEELAGGDAVTTWPTTTARRSASGVVRGNWCSTAFTVRKPLPTVRFFGIRRNDAWIEQILAQPRPHPEGQHNMRMLSASSMKRRVLVAGRWCIARQSCSSGRAAGVDVRCRACSQFVAGSMLTAIPSCSPPHYLEEAQTLCSICHVKAGRVVASTPPTTCSSAAAPSQGALNCASQPRLCPVRDAGLRLVGSLRVRRIEDVSAPASAIRPDQRADRRDCYLSANQTSESSWG